MLGRASAGSAGFRLPCRGRAGRGWEVLKGLLGNQKSSFREEWDTVGALRETRDRR